MPKIKKPLPPEYIVIVDTNILYCSDKSKVVNPEFDMFWSNYSKLFPMKLFIPEVVKGEILYQQSFTAKENLDKANDCFVQISNIAEKECIHKIDFDNVKNFIEERFMRWVKYKKAIIKATPIEKINWKNVVESSIWRILPFSRSSSKQNKEKGFRDMMIFETVCDIRKSYPKKINVAFICKDNDLRSTVNLKSPSTKGIIVYETLKDFESFILLTKENLTQEFVKTISSKAKDKFISDSSSLYFKEDIPNKITEKYIEKLNPHKTSNNFGGFMIPPISSLTPLGPEKRYIKKPQFINVISEKVYHWRSNVIFRRLFKQNNYLMMQTQTESNLRLLELTIEVKWKSNISRNGRFTKCEIENLNEISYSFDEPDEDILEQYDFNKYVNNMKRII
ncbi:MAG: hypothetical protein PF487_12065 [Bacteroidales bacterium]|jgi:rRNA-processing protein FCF1|nr:hypothetical protein [Bacteroidales bacterium]